MRLCNKSKEGISARRKSGVPPDFLDSLYDRNNRNETEADHLGQALLLISLVGDQTHPLVAKVLAEIPCFEVSGDGGKFIKGRSDFNEHPAHQTKWLKYGLRALGLPDPYTVPHVADGYSALFWMEHAAEVFLYVLSFSAI